MFDDMAWLGVKDGDPRLLALHRRHYSHYEYADGREQRRVVGPGERLVYLTPDARAAWVWVKMDYAFLSGPRWPGSDSRLLSGAELGEYDRLVGSVCCSFFRNEGTTAGRSSVLIREAVDLAWSRWPGAVLYTFVANDQVKSGVPGWCYFRAGWRRSVSVTARRWLHIWYLLPDKRG